jgi:hypothetical protein
MLPNAKLRQVGTRHIVSIETGGRNQDVGEVGEAHLRAYVATLPGSYTVPDSSTSAGERPGGQPGLDQARFTRAVQDAKNLLLSSDPQMSEIEAHRLASGQIAKQRPDLLRKYRADVRRV